MKLTKAIREQFVSDVLAGIPVKHHFNINDAMLEIRTLVEDKLPDDVKAFIKNHPNLIKREKRLRFESLISNRWGDTSVYVVDHDDCKVLPVTEYVILQKLNLDEIEERNVLSKRLLEISASCSTLAKLKVALPELESYMPVKQEVKRNLPIASGTVITDLLQLGLKIPK